MRIRFFAHSAVSDWNNGHAHFLRGVARELVFLGHDVVIFEAREGWSVRNLVADQGAAAAEEFFNVFPELRVERYTEADLELMLDGADLVIVQEWNEPELVAAIGRLRQRWRSFRLLFHDAHHRAVTAPQEMARFDLSGFDGVLAFGEVLRRIYLERSWTAAAWTWHEAADTRIFRPILAPEKDWDLVWVGNWGDGERSDELRHFLIEPIAELKLSARIFGVRYSSEAIAGLHAAGAGYAGWVANHRVPEVFARSALTVHVPRRPYALALPGIPTIRVFEALACGIPLVSAPWQDEEKLFTEGEDYLLARDGCAMKSRLADVLHDADLRTQLIQNGLAVIRRRHTCRHRAEELLGIAEAMGLPPAVGERVAAA